MLSSSKEKEEEADDDDRRKERGREERETPPTTLPGSLSHSGRLSTILLFFIKRIWNRTPSNWKTVFGKAKFATSANLWMFSTRIFVLVSSPVRPLGLSPGGDGGGGGGGGGGGDQL